MSKEEMNKMIEDKFNQIQIEENDIINQNYYNELISFMNEWFTIFLKEKEYILVFDYILKILVRINKYVNWNEYKAHQETVSCIYNYLNKMLSECDENVKGNIYNRLFTLKNNLYSTYEDIVIQYLYKNFQCEPFLKDKQKFAEINFDNCATALQEGYNTPTEAMYWLELYLSQKPISKEVEEICKPYSQIEEIKEMYTKYLLENNEK